MKVFEVFYLIPAVNVRCLWKFFKGTPSLDKMKQLARQVYNSKHNTDYTIEKLIKDRAIDVYANKFAIAYGVNYRNQPNYTWYYARPIEIDKVGEICK